MLDVDDDLALDQQVVIERQGVLREVDHALDRVLDRHHPEIDLALLDGVEHVGDGAIRDVLGGVQIGLGAQCLLGERAERPEEPHPCHCHRAKARAEGPPRRAEVLEIAACPSSSPS